MRSTSDTRFGISFILLFVFAAIWFAVLMPWGSMADVHYLEFQRSVGAYAATLVMFSYVIAGLWWDRYFMWLGIIVTVLTIVGYFALPQFFNLWMAFFGGGLLALSGLLVKRRWRPTS